MKKKKKLTPKQRAFVREYLICRNGAEAARRAGYGEEGARAMASHLLDDPEIMARIQANEERIEMKFEVTQDKIIQELAAIAFFDLRSVMRETDSGVAMKTWAEIDETISRAIQAVSENESQFGTSRSVKGFDKIAALKLLGLHIGMWKGKSGADDDKPTNLILNYNLGTPPKAD